ncbi:hypothetical protein R1sor_001523 [Riccia sorocarpa]|uniref:C-terminal of Roc (COR) domain-containing protein n=1 Tax=Riccia sorocarpa TaxID=122646 RepID=A0ABD3H0C2_9MARC
MGRALVVLLSSSSRTLKRICIFETFSKMVYDMVDAIQELAEGLQHPIDASREVELDLSYKSWNITNDEEKRIFDCLNFWREAGKCIPSQKTSLWFRGRAVAQFFRILNECNNLKEDEYFRSLMDLSQENIYLEEVEVSDKWESEGKDALVKEALRRNKAQAAYFSILRSAALPFQEAKVGRIFLCGEPFAGKTQLRATMIGKGPAWKLLERAGLKRTKGIDVELLRDDEKMQVTIWDFGGQEIFRALQSLLLPVITQACVFVIAFSPMTDDQKNLKKDLEEAFGKELELWLRFISASYPISGTFLPEVLVVITHTDLMKKHNLEGSCDWADRKLKQIKERQVYQKALNLPDKPYCMDAQKKKEVQPSVEKIFNIFSNMLQTKTPQAPKVSRLVSEILDLQKEKDHRPVWQVEKFYAFLSDRLKSQGLGCFVPNIDSERKILRAMSQYLHDVGSIFLLADSELVVTDINWLTHKFLGRLISEGHGLEAKTQILQKLSSPEGFVTRYALEDTLRGMSSKRDKLDTSTMIQVLVSLDLCYEVKWDRDVRIFTPTIVGKQRTGHEKLSWGTGESADWQHVGYRLLCENRDIASLTSSVFPRFQIRFRKELMDRGVIDDTTYKCEPDLIRLDWNGYFFIIENDSVVGDHVDILMRFSKSKNQQDAISFVKKEILEKFRLFCASPEGCRGVALATAIIRPDCVKILTPRVYRGNQIILEGCLKEKLREAVMQNQGLPKCSQQAVELLQDRDVEEILKPVHQGKEIRLQRLKSARKQVDDYLKEYGKEVITDVDMGGLRKNDKPSNLPDQERRLVEIITDTIKEDGSITRSQVHQEARGLHRHLEEVHVSLSRQLQHISTLEKEIRSIVLASATKIDDMLGDTAALADAEFPRRPFITVNDVGVGLQIGLAAGNALPELDLSLGFEICLIVSEMTVEKLGELESLPVIEQTEMTEEVCRILRVQLSKINIVETFKLQRVKYYPETVKVEESYAWLCDKCISEGKKNNVLRLA